MLVRTEALRLRCFRIAGQDGGAVSNASLVLVVSIRFWIRCPRLEGHADRRSQCEALRWGGSWWFAADVEVFHPPLDAPDPHLNPQIAR